MVRAFSYQAWLAGLRAGRTFITNGPAIWLEVAGQGPGSTLEVSAPSRLPATIRWRSDRPLNRVELVHDGEVVAREGWEDGRREGTLETRVAVSPSEGSGWVAARCFGDARTSYGHFLWAHTSPIYLRARPGAGTAGAAAPSPAARAAAAGFVEDLDRSLLWLRTRGKFHYPEQRDRMLGLFDQARERYAALARG